MNTKTGILMISMLALASMLFTSCSAPETHEIIGKWVPEDDAPRVIESAFLSEPVTLTEDPFFIFAADSTFQVEHFPEVLIGVHDSPRVFSGRGTWSVGEYMGMPVVFLRYLEIDGEEEYYDTQIKVTRFSPKRLYFQHRGEGGPTFVFKRVETGDDSPATE